MVEPAGANRDIGFSHWVLLPFWIPVIEVAIRWIVADLIRIDLLPNRISSNPLFISNPTNIGRLSWEDGNIPLGLANGFKPLVKGIGDFLSPIATRSIHPDFYKLALVPIFWIFKDFLELVEIVFIVLVLCIHMVERAVSIPRREVDPHIHVILAGRSRNLG